MLRKITSVLLILSFIFVLTGCFTNIHRVGNGPQQGVKVEQRQWYVLWGLVPINQVDSQSMAGGATDYEIKTEFTFVDIVIGFFTGIITVQPRTVKVTK
ncbi:MAG: hypothetical protein D6748_10425 [Calditrichaeota bacterium]|nr:MAG: hypothetical protein D6748_10425 [Calditrichota bacterium]